MKATLIEVIAVFGLFIGAMIPLVSGVVYFIRENKRLEKSHPSKK